MKRILLTILVSITAASAQQRIAVTYDKTVHIVFPERIVYFDLGSESIMARTVAEKPNVLRLKSAKRGFTEETNLSVILEDDSMHCFDVFYADTLETAVHVTSPSKPSEKPSAASDILSRNLRRITGTGCTRQDLSLTLKSLYCSSDAVYFHLELTNGSYMPYETEAVVFTVDKARNIRRGEPMGEELEPVETAGDPQTLSSNGSWNIVTGLKPFTVREDELLRIEVFEKSGRRHLSLCLDSRTFKRLMEKL